MLSSSNTLLIGVVSLKTNESLSVDSAHLFRGCVANMFPNNSLLHNHEKNGKEIYRYPVIQYKIIYGVPTLVGIGNEAIDLIEEIAKKIETLQIGIQKYNIVEVDFYVTEQKFGISEEKQDYLLVSPTILLNQDNYRIYKKLESKKQHDFVAKNITNQLISLSKRLNYTVETHITTTHQLDNCPISFKRKNLIGFHGHFSCNFHIANLLSIGKGVSRGYGSCMKLIHEKKKTFIS